MNLRQGQGLCERELFLFFQGENCPQNVFLFKIHTKLRNSYANFESVYLCN